MPPTHFPNAVRELAVTDAAPVDADSARAAGELPQRAAVSRPVSYVEDSDPYRAPLPTADTDLPSQADIDEARAQVGVGVWASGLRCVLIYVVAPLAGGLGGVLGLVGLVLQVAGAVTCCAGAAALWRLQHRARWPYTLLAAVIVATTCIALYEQMPFATS